jgi:predicted metalloenzyme YecM
MFESLPAFPENLLSELKALDIDFSELQIDHIAYRTLP